MTKNLFAIALLVALSACSEQPEIDPETLEDCIAIQDPNQRDICKMKLQQKAIENSKKAIGSKEFSNIDF